MAIFADVQYCIYADKVGEWGPKRPKICCRNIRMAPLQYSIVSSIRDSPNLSYEQHPCKNFQSKVWTKTGKPVSHIGGAKNGKIIWWLPYDYLMTSWWLPDDCLMTAWWLPDDCLTTAWWLPNYCLMTF